MVTSQEKQAIFAASKAVLSRKSDPWYTKQRKTGEADKRDELLVMSKGLKDTETFSGI